MTEQKTDLLRRQLRFRAWHRGTREADLLLGPFADAFLPDCPAADVAVFADLLTVDDPDLWDWVTGRAAPPAAHETSVLAALRRFVMDRQK